MLVEGLRIGGVYIFPPLPTISSSTPNNSPSTPTNYYHQMTVRNFSTAGLGCYGLVLGRLIGGIQPRAYWGWHRG